MCFAVQNRCPLGFFEVRYESPLLPSYDGCVHHIHIQAHAWGIALIYCIYYLILIIIYHGSIQVNSIKAKYNSHCHHTELNQKQC